MKANCNGYVQLNNKSVGRTYKHILEAERMLNRKLLLGEVVHHINKDRSDDSWDNLIVFKTSGDHLRHHRLPEDRQQLILLPNGSYTCKETGVEKRACIICGKSTGNASYCSLKCSYSLNSPRNLNRRKVERPSRTDLWKELWSKPAAQIARRLEVSDKSIEKWCRQYTIPKPPKGWWRKVNTGKFEGQVCPLPQDAALSPSILSCKEG